MHFVDIGCDRGEIVFHAVQFGAKFGVLIFWRPAVEIALMLLKENLTIDLSHQCITLQCNATQLPFKDIIIDRIFMLVVVEHLTPDELNKTLQCVRRLLKPSGYLIIHTMPSVWCYRFSYPIFRIFQRMRGNKLPNDPRERCEYSHLHVNEKRLLIYEESYLKMD